MEDEMGWRAIDTAPRDGSEILGWRKDCGTLLVRWIAPIDFMTDDEMGGMDEETANFSSWWAADFVAGCRIEGDEAPTHFMPLPAPPQGVPNAE